MANRIQRVPNGYLSLLGMVGSGETPKVTPDFLQPTIDIEPYFSADRVETLIDSTTGASVVADNASLVVPNGEIWRMVAMGGRATYSLVGGIANIQLLYATPSGPTVIPLTVGKRQVAVAATDVCDIGFVFPMPLILVAGSELRLRLNEPVTTGTVNLTVSAIFNRLDR